MNAIAAAAGLPPGKRMSIKNLAKRGAKGARRKPAVPPADDGDHEYR